MSLRGTIARAALLLALPSIVRAQTTDPPTDAAEPTRPETFVVDRQRSPDQKLVPRPDNANLATLQPPAGFFSIPNTSIQLKPGGDVSAVFFVSSKLAPGAQTGLVTSSIPVPGQAGYATGVQVTASANQTNLSLDFRMATPFGPLRMLYDNDFYTSSSSSFVYDLDYLYVQVANLLIGFSDSAFVDPDAWPATLDYAGNSADVFKRHVLVQYTWVVFKHQHSDLFVRFSVEQPGAQIPTAVGNPWNVAPDGAIAVRLEAVPGHLQLGTVVRAVGEQNVNSGAGQIVCAWGLSLSGALNLWAGDILTAGVAGGQGLAAYFHDAGSPPVDAALNGSGQLTAVPILGTFVGYTHQWTQQWSSTASYGLLLTDTSAVSTSLGPNGYSRAQYASLNVVYRPWKPLLIGIEGLWGYQRVVSGGSGDLWRMQTNLQFTF